MNQSASSPTSRPSALRRLSHSSTLSIFLILLFMCAALAIAAPAFIKPNNLLSTARNFSNIAIAGIGVSMVIIIGGIDLSIGSVYGLAGVVSAMAAVAGVPLALALLLGVLAGALVGLLNGAMVVYFRLPPFIATLGTMQIVRGVCQILTRGYPVSNLPAGYTFLGQGYLLGVPLPIWLMVILALLFALFFNMTATGRRIFALGGNESATRISGINVSRLKLLVFTLGGALAAVAGIIAASKLGVGQPTAGEGFEMDAIAAVVIGGASLSGGEGTVTGTIIGAAIIGVLRNALVLLSIEGQWQKVIIGAIVILAVTVDQLRKRRK